jgi:hypothetical protein
MNSWQIGWGGALCVLLAGNTASPFNDQFRSANVSEKLSVIRELVSLNRGSNITGLPFEEADNCYAGYWRNC